jgi:hypothetical protein
MDPELYHVENVENFDAILSRRKYLRRESRAIGPRSEVYNMPVTNRTLTAAEMQTRLGGWVARLLPQTGAAQPKPEPDPTAQPQLPPEPKK